MQLLPLAGERREEGAVEQAAWGDANIKNHTDPSPTPLGGALTSLSCSEERPWKTLALMRLMATSVPRHLP